MPWQQHVADVAGEIDPATGLFRRSTVIVTVPRQCGKTTLDRGYANTRCLTVAGTVLAATAQTGKDARQRFVEASSQMMRSPLKPLFRRYLAAGSERLEWVNGSQDRVFSPQPDAVHGSTLDGARVDEAFAFDVARGSELEQALLPTFATRRMRPPGTQLWILSTAGTDDATWLRRWVDMGRAAAADPSSPIAFFEWAAGPDDDHSDPDVWRSVHPGLGHTISQVALSADLAIMTPENFSRAYLNRWSRTSDRVIGAPEWAACLDRGATAPVRGIVLGVDVAYSRQWATIAAAAPRPDGRVHVEVVDHRPGTSWLHDRTIDLARRYRAPVAVDPSGPAGPLAASLKASRVRLAPVANRDLAAASAAFSDAVSGRHVVHIGQPELDDAVAAAVRRPMGDAWAWGRRQSAQADVSPLVAVSIARHVLVTQPLKATITVLRTA